MAATLNREQPAGEKQWRLRAIPWRTENSTTHRALLWSAFGMVFGLLLIGCANLCSILLARSLSRRRDYAIRLATGASRSRVVRQSLLEVWILAFCGLLLAVVLSAGVLHLVRAASHPAGIGVADLARARLNGGFIFFSFALTLFAALVSGLAPALSATAVDLYTGLRESGTHAATGHRVSRLMQGLVAVEAGLCVTLLVTSGLLVRSLVRLVDDDHGIRPDRVLTMRLPYGSWQRPSPRKTENQMQREIRRYLQILRQVESVRGVDGAALASSLPLSDVSVTTDLGSTQAVTRNYFRVMGIPLVSGRSFTSQDGPSRPAVGVVNQAFVKKYFGGRNPIGQQLRDANGKPSVEVIGVVRDSTQVDLNEPVQPQIYLHFEQKLLTPFLTGLVVRSATQPASLVPRLRAAVASEDPGQAMVEAKTLQRLVDDNIRLSRSSAWFFSLFGALALTLAGVGIYGVVAYVTASRRREYGIRLALGATNSRLFYGTTWRSLMPVLVGAVAGAALAFGGSRFLAALLYHTSPYDLFATGGSVAALLVIAFAASAIPAARVARIDPAVILRAE